MIKEFKGDITDLVSKANLISDRLALFKGTFPNFNYTIRLKIGKKESILKVDTCQ